MEKRQMLWKTKGMNKDLSVSAFNPEFAFENMNLRLSTNEKNTLMSWVNEKGTEELILYSDITQQTPMVIEGIPIGTAVIDHKLVLFTTTLEDPDNVTPGTDRIYVIEKEGDAWKGNLLFTGNLKFDTQHPLETLVSYEMEDVQKVYWVDGKNQPRVINIEGRVKEGVNTQFDFVPALGLKESIEISKSAASGGGLFAPGVIQYGFTYVNKYGQESNMVMVSPIQYLSHVDRGASPDEMVTDSFTITINDVDQNFDYLRLYSIHRSSLNDVPQVKLLEEIDTASSAYSEKYVLSDEPIIYDPDFDNNFSRTLPVTMDEGEPKKVESLEIKNGTYRFIIIPSIGTSALGYTSKHRYSPLCFRGYNDNINDSVFIKSLQEFMAANSSYVIFNHPIASVLLDENVWRLIQQDSGYTHISLQITENTELPYELDPSVPRNILGKYLVYNLINKKWYLTDRLPTIGNPVEYKEIIYQDNGTTGSSIDPQSLLYVGGREITALTIIDKSNTLFLGNIEEKTKNLLALQQYYQESPPIIESVIDVDQKAVKRDDISPNDQQGFYSYQSQLGNSRRQITTFKGGEIYRLGVQFQKVTGEWSEPIFLKDVTNTLYPDSKAYEEDIALPFFQASINFSNTSLISSRDYKKIRPLIVYPTIGDRRVLCQGVLNPTVFNVEDRKQKLPYSQASWYFRPYMVQDEETTLPEPSTKVAYLSGLDETDWDGYDNGDLDDSTKNKNVWVIHCTGTSSNIENIISRKYLLIWDVGEFWAPWYFDAIIIVSQTVSNTECLFIGNYAPTITGTIPQVKDVDAQETYMSNSSYPIYKGLRTYHNEYFFRTEENHSEYYFKYKVGNINNPDYYVVTFTGIDSSDVGSGVRYMHYASLYDDSLAYDESNVFAARQAEIQGSVNIYDSPFAQTQTPTVSSNTQFFVDQSIITLNSPDIEFDTEVQRYGTDGLKLRVIGAIPITGNVAAYEMQTSSAMLSLGYNVSPSNNTFGSGTIDKTIQYNNISLEAGHRLVSEYLWNDAEVYNDGGTYKTEGTPLNYLIYPWHRSAALNNDTREQDKASSWLKKKKESNLLYSINTEYFGHNDRAYNVDYEERIGVQLHLTENNYIGNIRLSKQKSTSSDINYYPNIDKILVTEKNSNSSTDLGYVIKSDPVGQHITAVSTPISMKYKSTSHAVIALDDSKDSEHNIYILPSGEIGETSTPVYIGKYDTSVHGTTFWGDTEINFNQPNVDMRDMFQEPVGGDVYTSHALNWLWLGELYKESINPFGGTGREAILANNWVVGGEEVDFPSEGPATLRWTEGDTYFQRYDCLKTYPFSPEDTNQLVEILSFMVETHVNIDGRYDKNRGQQVSYNMTPENFNLMNYVYSQQDNFFTYKKVDIDGENKRHPNQIAYSLTKTPGADVDLWTNVNMGSILELDGDKGEITKLMRLNDQLLAFQDSGISQILYNENVQISTEQGVPIEIANSGKVQGARYLSNTIGCSNKWSMAQTPAGIYFMDSNDKSIYLLGEGLKNVTLESGFNTWAKQEIKKGDGFKAFYDKLNQEVLFINQDRALAWSEKMGAFTSFYSYGGAPYFVNLDDEGLWVNKDNGTSGTNETDGAFKLWKHQGGDYGKFFGVNEPYWTILVGNPNPQMDKTFTNLEFRACVDGDGVIPAGETSGTVKFYPTLPFDSLEVWNEYQHGEVTLELRNGQAAAKHHTNDGKAGLNRKFRIWRCDIPRDNWDVCLKPDPLPVDPAPTQEEIAAYEEAMAAYNDEVDKGIYRYSKHPLDRMRNPWLYLKLMKEAATDALQRTEVHDMMMSYFV